jgi:hypothetical protein
MTGIGPSYDRESETVMSLKAVAAAASVTVTRYTPDVGEFYGGLPVRVKDVPCPLGLLIVKVLPLRNVHAYV